MLVVHFLFLRVARNAGIGQIIVCSFSLHSSSSEMCHFLPLLQDFSSWCMSYATVTYTRIKGAYGNRFLLPGNRRTKLFVIANVFAAVSLRLLDTNAQRTLIPKVMKNQRLRFPMVLAIRTLSLKLSTTIEKIISKNHRPDTERWD